MTSILVVEDKEYWQKLLTEILSDHNYESICASTQEAAFQALNNFSKIDLVIADINLTDVHGNRDGEGIIEYILGKRPSLPIIIVSGTIPADSINLRGRSLTFFSKQSFDGEDFLSKVDKIIGKRGLTDHREVPYEEMFNNR